VYIIGGLLESLWSAWIPVSREWQPCILDMQFQARVLLWMSFVRSYVGPVHVLSRYGNRYEPLSPFSTCNHWNLSSWLVITADPVCVTVFVVVSLHSWPIDVVHCFFSVFNNKCNMINAWSAHALLFACNIFYAEFAQLMVSVRRTYDAIRRFLCSLTCLLDRAVCKRVETRSSAVAEKAPCIQIQVRVWIRPGLLLLVYLHVFWKILSAICHIRGHAALMGFYPPCRCTCLLICCCFVTWNT